MIDSETLLDEEYQVWKVFGVLYSLIFISFVLDIMNVSFLWSPTYFNFVPLLLFVGAIKFPRLLIYGVVFSLGLLSDVLSYAPIGLTGCLYFLTVFLCKWQHRFILAQPFHVIWLFFVFYWGAFVSINWVVQSLFARFIFEFSPAVSMFLYGVFLFPLVWSGFQMIKAFFSDIEDGLSR